MSDNLVEQEAAAEATPSAEAATADSELSSDHVETVEASTETPSVAPLLDGKFKTEEAREQSYKELERRFHEQNGRLAELQRRLDGQPTTKGSESSEPKWKQLESERNKWAQHLRRGELSEQDRWQADEQVRLYDREIAREQAKYEILQESTRTGARQTLEQDSLKIINQYQTDLNNQSSPLYQASAQRYEQLVRAGYPDDMNTKALAVAYAASVTGATVSKAVQQDRSAMLKTLNKTAKQAVVAGAGGPATVKPSGVTPKDIETMSDAEFRKYERSVLGV